MVRKRVTDKYLCIHGHFYQPPRENPWLGAIEHEASAHPFHDWNDRITRECYGPNARSRLSGQGGRILKLINNYEHMSFNFGPTLLSWLEKAHPWIYSQILAADKASQVRYGGHGNAIAQVFNHIIMPLARRQDKITQIRWGLADFKHRFGRPAEGMWLAETAVDTETLGLMVQEGVKFTILSPAQARSVRPLAGRARATPWQDVSDGQITPTCPYRVLLDKSGERFIDVFFYDGPLSRAVAYEEILGSGEDFLAWIEQTFDSYHDGPQLVNIATDGESYGHHFEFGDMALSWLFHHLEQTGRIKLTNYAFFLERFPPKNEVKLFENSSWSCSHGVERWRADCGCSVTHTPGWNQAWRAPLREGLDWLADELTAIFEELCGRLLKDPWEARNDYIAVLLQPSSHQRELFLKRHAALPLGAEEKIKILRMMESQVMSLYMFTSCGWFFDDISGLEATQVLKYAARVLDLVQSSTGRDLEPGLIDFLVKAKSNDLSYRHGGQVYQALVKSSRIDSSLATAHYAFFDLVEKKIPQETCPFSEMVSQVRERRFTVQGLRVIIGETLVTEKGTGGKFRRAYVAFGRDRKHLSCLVGENVLALDLDNVAEKVYEAFKEASKEEVRGVLSQHLTSVKSYGIKDLSPDSRKCLIEGLASNLDKEIRDFIWERNGAVQELMSLALETGESTPEALNEILRMLIADELTRLIDPGQEEDTTDWPGLHRLAAQVKFSALTLNQPTLRQKARNFLLREIKHLGLTSDQISITNIISFLNLVQDLNLDLDLWECQNVFYDLYKDPSFAQALHPALSPLFAELAQRLGFLFGGE